jgi:hypothetical protein
MGRKKGIASMIMGSFMLAMVALFPAFAADLTMEKMLPDRGFAEDWIMEGRVNLYNPEALFEHINGEAELYVPYGFEMLATAAYANRKNPDVWVVADVYRMASLLDAFGIYSNYRKADYETAPIGAEGFVSPSQLMFYQDRYFVRLQVTGTTSLEQSLLLACGRAVSRNLPPRADRPGEMEVLRIPGIVPKSERYLAKSLLGYAFFRRGMIAEATLDGEKVRVFIVIEASQDAARRAFDQYHAYLKAEGQRIQWTETSEGISLTSVDPLYGGVVAEQYRRHVIGVVGMKETSATQQLVDQLRLRLGGGDR